MGLNNKTHLDSPPTSIDDAALYRAHSEILEMVVSGKPLEEICSKIALLIESASPTNTWCAIFKRDNNSPELELAAAPSAPENFLVAARNYFFTKSDKVFGEVFTTGEISISEYSSYDFDSKIKANSAIPVFCDSDDIIAVISIFHHEATCPKETEIRFAESLGKLLGFAISKSISSNEIIRSNMRFKSVSSVINNVVWDYNIEDKTIWWSDDFSKLFGYDGPGNGPNLEEWKNRIHPDDRERVLNELAFIQNGALGQWIAEYRVIRSNGSIAHIIDQAELIFNSAKKPIRMIGAISDISSLKQTQSELTDLNRALEMLSASNKLLIRAADETQLLTDICKVAVDIGGYVFARVCFAGTGKDKPINIIAEYGENRGYLQDIQTSYAEKSLTGSSPGAKTIRSGKAVISEDIRNENVNAFWKKYALDCDFRSLICLPLKDDEKCFGFIDLYSTRVNAISKKERKLLSELANNISFGIITMREHVRAEATRDSIVKVAQTISPGNGEDFHKLLTTNLIMALGADGGVIGKVDLKNKTVSTQSFIMNGSQRPNFSYDIRNTPCENVTSKHACLYPESVQSNFPKDHTLAELEIEAYAGIPLFTKDDKQAGILAVFFKKPITDPQLVTNILSIFAERAASEMEQFETGAILLEQASLLDKARDAIFTHDLNHNIVFWNKSAERLYGYPKAFAVGKQSRDLLHIDTNGYDQAYASTLKYSEWIGELHQLDTNENPLIVESRWSLVRDKSGEPVSILTINTDITEHKQLEQQFLRAQRLESIGTLAGGLAHDLNNVLAPISMSIQLLRGSVNDERGRELLDTLAKSSKRGAEIVSQIVTFARGEEGQNSQIKAGEIIQEIAEIVSDTFPKNIQIETQINPNLYPILADATQIHQVLLNLAVNSRDAMPEGGKILISATNKRINNKFMPSITGSKNGSYICIQVEDSGSGIPEDIIAKIFDPFFTTKSIGKGSGLGLSSSQKIIKNLGGFINCNSQIGKGTEFSIYLPAMQEESVQPSVTNSDEEFPHGNGETILIIDDEEAILHTSSSILEYYGYMPITAISGEEAVAIYQKGYQEIDIVITDMMMPGMSGPETIDAILDINAKAQFITVSGIKAKNDIIQSKPDNVKHFIQKPFTASTLLTTLAAALAQRNI